MKIESTTKIISTCFEINNDIINIYNDSKLPKLIRKYRKNHYTKKLINTINKLYKANAPIDRETLIEFFTYIYNSYQPSGSYENIEYTHINQKTKLIDAKISSGDDFTAFITINDTEKNIDIRIINSKLKNSNYNITLTKLRSYNAEASKVIEKLNSIIWSNIADYIIDGISMCDNI